MGKFICPEIEGADGIYSLMDAYNSNPQTALMTDGTLGYPIMAIKQNSNGSKVAAYEYGVKAVLDKIFTERLKSSTTKTIAQLATAIELTITQNFTDTTAYQWRFNRVAALQSSMWWTILTQDGLYFAIPARTSTSKQVNNYTFVKSVVFSGSVGYVGESGYDVGVSVMDYVDGVIPVSIGTAQKTYRVNKAISARAQATVMVSGNTGLNVNPLDYFQYDGNVYIIVSKRIDGNDYYLTGVLESTSAPSFSTGTLAPEINAVSDGALTTGLVVETTTGGKLTATKSTGTAAGNIPLIGSDLSASAYVETDANGKLKTVAKESWQTPTLVNSWANVGSGQITARYKKINSVVYLYGLVSSGSAAKICQLPTGYRPAATMNFPAVFGGNYVSVDSSGNVTASSTSGYIQMNAVFIADN